MLLPSDIARLVLGYLQQEGLCATSQAFILESPNLKEYAEHSTDDGAIPACVFSLFGKNLATILNEYVAAKAKETSHENQIPAMMTSLWKKLDFTLNQIKCMQNSPTVQQNQRARTRHGIVNMRRQRALSSTPAPGSRLLSIPAPASQYVSSPISTSQGVLGHSTPICYSALQTRPSPLCVSQPPVQEGSRLVINVTRDSPLHVVVPDARNNSAPLSPGRRKCDSPRRRGGGLSGLGGPGRAPVVSSAPVTEQQSEPHQEAVSENFPQMVIENAREKILNDKSLQEKLAKNINKFLASDISPQTSRQATCSSIDQDQSIDEILGLQGEIHMTDDAIQDILEQTESDPAFQALFELFEYGKEGHGNGDEQGDGCPNSSIQESDGAEADKSTGTRPEESTAGAEAASKKSRSKNAQDSKSKKSRKATHPFPSTPRATQASNPSRSLNEVRLDARGRTETRTTAGDSRMTKTSQPATQAKAASDGHSQESPKDVSGSLVPEEDVSIEMDCLPTALSPGILDPASVLRSDSQESPQTSRDPGFPPCETAPSEPSTAAGSCSGATERPVLGFHVEVPHLACAMEAPEGHPASPPVSPHVTDQAKKAESTHSPSPCRSAPPCVSGKNNGEVSPGEFQTNALSSSPSMSEATVSLIADPAASPVQIHSMSAPSAAGKEPDPSKIVSLKIIISDEPDEQCGDAALSQAVSSITGEKIPTIILSSPAKSPAKGLSGTAGSSFTLEETVQAVSSLQKTEAFQSAELNPLTGRSGDCAAAMDANGQLVPEAGFIQLVPAGTSYGNPGSYFIVTEPATVGQPSNVMVLPNSGLLGHLTPPHALATPPRSQTYSPGSTLIISSPVQPLLQRMMVPGKFTVVSNQLLTLPVPSVKNQAKAKPKQKLAPKDTTESGRAGTSVSDPRRKASDAGLRPVVSSPSSEPLEEQPVLSDSPAASSPRSHRRMLCFDTDAAPLGRLSPPSAPQTPNAGGPSSGSAKVRSVRPAILGGRRLLKKVEAVKPVVNSRVPGSEETPASQPPAQHEGNGADPGVETRSASPRKDAAPTHSSKRKPQTLDTSEDSPARTKGEVAQSDKPSTSDLRTKSKLVGSRKEVEPRTRPEAKGREARAERRSSSQEPPHVTANKENEMEGSRREAIPPSATTQGEPAATVPAPLVPSCKAPSKTSPLTKQATEMLQDIQGQNPSSTPSKRLALGFSELALPRTPGSGGHPEEAADCLRTPARQRHGREREGTPRHLPPPATPDMPTCSPASEAGSESSINMAAHTLMILSRAAIARTGTPLKDSVRQQGTSVNALAAHKGKKRKQTESPTSPAVKKEMLQLPGPPVSKKAKKQKKLLDSFPIDLDVDKFLSSLHYDE